jgi:hypothetical protein
LVHKIISVYGNSGSYKTITALNIAKTISELDSNANVAIVGLDTTKPLIPVLFPKQRLNASLGKLLSLEYFDQDSILSQMNMNGRVGVLGYGSGENYNSHAFPVDGRIDDFFMQMRHLVNYTIVDCTSNIASDKLTAKAIINADEVVYLLSCDICGLVFHHSQEPILLSEQYGYSNFKRYLTISGRFSQDTAVMENSITYVKGVIPFSTAVTEQINQGIAFERVSDGKYNRAINAIAQGLMEE